MYWLERTDAHVGQPRGQEFELGSHPGRCSGSGMSSLEYAECGGLKVQTAIARLGRGAYTDDNEGVVNRPQHRCSGLVNLAWRELGGDLDTASTLS